MPIQPVDSLCLRSGASTLAGYPDHEQLEAHRRVGSQLLAMHLGPCVTAAAGTDLRDGP